MPSRFHSRPPRLRMVATVLALHLLAAGMLATVGSWRDRGRPAPQRPPVIVTLPQFVRPPPQPPAAIEARPATRATPRASPPDTPPPAPSPEQARPAAPQAITLPPLTRAPEAPAAAPLNLALPRAASAPWRQRNPALDDPRANTARRTLESSIAAAMGGGDQISEEHLADGSIRFRRGSSCVIARPNRAQTLDPFNASVMPKPRLIEKC